MLTALEELCTSDMHTLQFAAQTLNYELLAVLPACLSRIDAVNRIHSSDIQHAKRNSSEPRRIL
ncbi:hypothetical protein [Nocardia nepalensis]|uniref:hypothetical protein n=1 Tax=Nocardia nepalensis TaxID=3375448 RepID=UPI003B6734BC